MNPNYKLIDMMGLISLQGNYADKIAIYNIKTIIKDKDNNKEMKKNTIG